MGNGAYGPDTCSLSVTGMLGALEKGLPVNDISFHRGGMTSTCQAVEGRHTLATQKNGGKNMRRTYVSTIICDKMLCLLDTIFCWFESFIQMEKGSLSL